MHKIIFGLIIFFSISSIAQPNVCVFALNDAKEDEAFKNFFSKNNITVEYQAAVKDSDSSFVNTMFKSFIDKQIKSGKTCDFMTISGHHSGEFWGENVFGRLSLNDIYELSCDPKYADFFREIKGWWLLGCQTDGLNIKSAEEEAARLLRECETSENSEYCDYSRNLITYGGLYDKDAPYLSALQSISPKSYMFAFTKKAPLSSTGSLETFDRQFKKTGSIISNELKNSLQVATLPTGVTDINAIVSRLLNPNSTTCDNCSVVGDEIFELGIVKGWNQHMGEYYSPNALPPLDRSAVSCRAKGSKLLSKDVLTKLPLKELVSCHHDINCMLQNQIEGLQCIEEKDFSCSSKFDAETSKKLLEVITNSENSEAYSIFARSFNHVESLIRELRRVKPETWSSQVKPALQKNYNQPKSILKAYFENRIDPPLEVRRDPDFVKTSPLRKMAVFSVESAILESSSQSSILKEHKSIINEEVGALLSSSDLKNKNFNDYRQELVRAQYFYELKDINKLEKANTQAEKDSNRPTGVSFNNGQYTFTDSSQMLGLVEYLSNRDSLNLSENNRQSTLLKLITKTSKSDINSLNEIQKADFYESFQSINIPNLIKDRNEFFIKTVNPSSIWGIGSFLSSASSDQIDVALAKIEPNQLSDKNKKLLINNLSMIKSNSKKIGSMVNDLKSPKLNSVEDASLYIAVQNSDSLFQKDRYSIHLQDQLKSKKYSKAEFIRDIRFKMGLTPSEQYKEIINYLGISKDYDRGNDSCGLGILYSRKYKSEFNISINTSKNPVPGC